MDLKFEIYETINYSSDPAIHEPTTEYAKLGLEGTA